MDSKLLQEILNAKQVPGELPRRWFNSPSMDLIVWHDRTGMPAGFQICYDKESQERALHWRVDGGFLHYLVQDGESDLNKESPMLTLDGMFDAKRIAKLFLSEATQLPVDVRSFVLGKLQPTKRDIELTSSVCLPEDVLDFWFGKQGTSLYGEKREVWFTRSNAFDNIVRETFQSTWRAALVGDLHDWTHDARSELALIILLDQFPRKMFRGSSQAYVSDPNALAVAQQLVTSGKDRDLNLLERMFAYMPFQHSENMQIQEKSVLLYKELKTEGLQGVYTSARKHRDVIKQFGRFPHRNSILRRESTPAELEFLKDRNSGF